MRRCVWCGFGVRRPKAKVCVHCEDLERRLRDYREGLLPPRLRVV